HRGFHKVFGTIRGFAMIARFLDPRLGTRPNARQVWAALTFFANFMTQGAGPLTIKNVLAGLDKILDWRIRRQDEFLGGILTQLRDTVPDIQKKGDDHDIKRKHLQECLHASAFLPVYQHNSSRATPLNWRGSLALRSSWAQH